MFDISEKIAILFSSDDSQHNLVLAVFIFIFLGKEVVFVTVAERSMVVRAAVNEADLVLYGGGDPSKERLATLISMLDNVILCITSVPGYIPAEVSSLKALRGEACDKYRRKGGKITRSGLDTILS